MARTNSAAHRAAPARRDGGRGRLALEEPGRKRARPRDRVEEAHVIGGEDERGLARQAVPPAALQPERPGGDPGGEAEQEAARDARSAAWCGKLAARALGE